MAVQRAFGVVTDQMCRERKRETTHEAVNLPCVGMPPTPYPAQDIAILHGCPVLTQAKVNQFRLSYGGQIIPFWGCTSSSFSSLRKIKAIKRKHHETTEESLHILLAPLGKWKRNVRYASFACRHTDRCQQCDTPMDANTPTTTYVQHPGS